MSLIKHRFLPRHKFDMDRWLTPSLLEPSTLDMFDPFDDLDRLMGRNFHWLNEPELVGASGLVPHPRVPNKYRIHVDCVGYSPKSIKIDISEDKSKVIVSGSEGEPVPKDTTEDYTHRQFRRSYKVPKNAELDKLASFMTSNGQLVIEIPLKEDEHDTRVSSQDLLPRVVDGDAGSKQVKMVLPVPHGLDPSKIKVTCKDRDLIVQAEDKQESSDRISQTYFYRRCTLPENTDFNALKCEYDDQNRLAISAPLHMDYSKHYSRTVPIEYHNKGHIEHKK